MISHERTFVDNWAKREEDQAWIRMASDVVPDAWVQSPKNIIRSYYGDKKREIPTISEEQTNLALQHPYIEIAARIAQYRKLTLSQLAGLIHRSNAMNEILQNKGVRPQYPSTQIVQWQRLLGTPQEVINAAQGSVHALRELTSKNHSGS